MRSVGAVDILLVLMLLSTLRGRVNGVDKFHPCSSKWCYQDYPKPIVNCGWLGLTSVPSFPSNLTTTVRTLLLYGNDITLKHNTFVHFANLERLDLKWNHIKNITTGMFIGLSKLTTLDISKNYIQTILNP